MYEWMTKGVGARMKRDYNQLKAGQWVWIDQPPNHKGQVVVVTSVDGEDWQTVPVNELKQ